MEKNIKLSGPVSLYLGQYNKKKYIFLGDHHSADFKYTCNSSCNSFNVDDMNETVTMNFVGNNCYEITFLLASLFETNQWIDFYHEGHFRKNIERTVYNPSRINGKIEQVFEPCFNKRKECEYKKTRFHYMDIRRENINISLEEYRGMFPTYRILPTIDKKYIMKYIDHGLTSYLQTEIKKIIGYEIVDVIKLKNVIDSFYLDNENMDETLINRLFRLYITSDDIKKDIRNLLKQYNFEFLENFLLPQNIIVERDGKIMFRARSQLYSLEKEGNIEIADMIKLYIINRMREYQTIYTPTIKDFSHSLNIINGTKISNKLNPYFIEARRIINNTRFMDALLVDAYTLARMFRSFNNDPKHIDSTKAIIYFGQFHIDNYVEFFEKYLNVNFIKYEPKNPFHLGKHYEHSYIENEQCIEISQKDFEYMFQ